MPQHPIGIVGAGFGGLVLARRLGQRGIPYVLFDKEKSRPKHGRSHGITLHPWAYRPLLECLKMDENTFRASLAVDKGSGGSGSVRPGSLDRSFRADRRKLHRLLGQGLDIRWDHELASIESEDGTNVLHFTSGEQSPASIVVGADGGNGRVRQLLSPATEPTVLPYAVYNGKCKVHGDAFAKQYAPYMQGASMIEREQNGTFMQIAINQSTGGYFSLSYIYSRPSRRHDPLFNPNRLKTEANQIPSALFEEIADLGDIEKPFPSVFNADRMRGDRLLNWLMRTHIIPKDDLMSAAANGIVLLGDSAHAQPILGGWGANAAIVDGLELAALGLERSGYNLAQFYDLKYETWQKDVKECEKRISCMHGMSNARL